MVKPSPGRDISIKLRKIEINYLFPNKRKQVKRSRKINLGFMIENINRKKETEKKAEKRPQKERTYVYG